MRRRGVSCSHQKPLPIPANHSPETAGLTNLPCPHRLGEGPSPLLSSPPPSLGPGVCKGGA